MTDLVGFRLQAKFLFGLLGSLVWLSVGFLLVFFRELHPKYCVNVWQLYPGLLGLLLGFWVPLVPLPGLWAWYWFVSHLPGV